MLSICSVSVHGNEVAFISHMEKIVFLTTFLGKLDLRLLRLCKWSLEDWHHVVGVKISEDFESCRKRILFDEIVYLMLDSVNLLLFRHSVVNIWTMVRSLTASGIRLVVHLVDRRRQIIVIHHHLELHLLSLNFLCFSILSYLLVGFDAKAFGNELERSTHPDYGNDRYDLNGGSQDSVVIRRDLQR